MTHTHTHRGGRKRERERERKRENLIYRNIDEYMKQGVRKF